MSVLATMSEKHWQWQVLQAARLYGWWVWHDYDSRRNRAGLPDLLLLRPPRPLLVLELKTENGRVTAEQEHVLELFRGAGAECYIMRPSQRDFLLELLR